MVTDYNRDLRCVDCRYASGRVAALLWLTPLGMKCRLPASWVPGNWDPVFGKETKGYWQTCGTMRIKAECGPEAKGWVPRGKKHIFLALKKFDK